jgi:hypothetical protein
MPYFHPVSVSLSFSTPCQVANSSPHMHVEQCTPTWSTHYVVGRRWPTCSPKLPMIKLQNHEMPKGNAIMPTPWETSRHGAVGGMMCSCAPSYILCWTNQGQKRYGFTDLALWCFCATQKYQEGSKDHLLKKLGFTLLRKFNTRHDKIQEQWKIQNYQLFSVWYQNIYQSIKQQCAMKHEEAFDTIIEGNFI